MNKKEAEKLKNQSVGIWPPAIRTVHEGGWEHVGYSYYIENVDRDKGFTLKIEGCHHTVNLPWDCCSGYTDGYLIVKVQICVDGTTVTRIPLAPAAMSYPTIPLPPPFWRITGWNNSRQNPAFFS